MFNSNLTEAGVGGEEWLEIRFKSWVRAGSWRAWGMPGEKSVNFILRAKGNHWEIWGRHTDKKQQDFDSYSASRIWPCIRMTRIACYKSCYQGSTPRPFQSAFPGMWPRNYILKRSFQVIPGHPAWHSFMKQSLGITALLTNAFLKSCCSWRSYQ